MKRLLLSFLCGLSVFNTTFSMDYEKQNLSPEELAQVYNDIGAAGIAEDKEVRKHLKEKKQDIAGSKESLELEVEEKEDDNTMTILDGQGHEHILLKDAVDLAPYFASLCVDDEKNKQWNSFSTGQINQLTRYLNCIVEYGQESQELKDIIFDRSLKKLQKDHELACFVECDILQDKLEVITLSDKKGEKFLIRKTAAMQSGFLKGLIEFSILAQKETVELSETNKRDLLNLVAQLHALEKNDKITDDQCDVLTNNYYLIDEKLFYRKAMENFSWSMIKECKCSGNESVDFSPCGMYIVSGGGRSGIVQVWSLEDNKEVKTFEYDEFVSSVSFSPCGTYIVSGGGGGIVRVWSLKEDREIKTFEYDEFVSSVSFSPCGMYIVSGGGGGIVRIWSLKEDREIKTFKHDHCWFVSVSFSPCGKYVVSGGGGSGIVRVWSLKKYREIKTFEHDRFVHSVSFSPCGMYIVSGGGGNGIVRVWSLKEDREIKIFKHDGYWVSAVSFSPCGKFIVSSGDDKVQVWSLNKKNNALRKKGFLSKLSKKLWRNPMRKLKKHKKKSAAVIALGSGSYFLYKKLKKA